MTREQFKNKLKIDRISYSHDEDENIIVKGEDIELDYLKEISEDVIFRNKGIVDLSRLGSIPNNTIFENDGIVNLMGLVDLPPGVKFRNKGDVWLNSINYIPKGVEFTNDGGISLEMIDTTDFGGFKLHIDGISDIRILLMLEEKKIL